MGDLKNPRWMYLKAILFVIGGIISGGLILLGSPEWRTAVLLAVCVWCFARAYYFAFYVIEHYIDDDFRYAGISSAIRYWFRRRDR